MTTQNQRNLNNSTVKRVAAYAVTPLHVAGLALGIALLDAPQAQADNLNSYYGSGRGLESVYGRGANFTNRYNGYSNRGFSRGNRYSRGSYNRGGRFTFYKRGTGYHGGSRHGSMSDLGLSGSAHYTGDHHGKYTVSSNYTTVGSGKIRKRSYKIVYPQGEAPRLPLPSGNYARAINR